MPGGEKQEERKRESEKSRTERRKRSERGRTSGGLERPRVPFAKSSSRVRKAELGAGRSPFVFNPFSLVLKHPPIVPPLSLCIHTPSE